MAASIGKYAANKLMSKKAKEDQANRLADGRDPYFYLETDKHGRTKKRTKSSPAHYPLYIPLADRERLNSFRRYAKLMDTALFGQVGMSFFVGLVPVAGDFADGGISWLLVQKYANTISCGLPKSVYARMMSNITIDVAIGFVPVLGDIADAVYKANIKNLVILEDYLRKVFKPQEGSLQQQQIGQGGLAAVGTTQQQGHPVEQKKVLGGFFGGGGGGGKREKGRDLEMAQTGDVQIGHVHGGQETGTVTYGPR